MEPRIVEQNELKDNGIDEGSVEREVIAVESHDVSQRPQCNSSRNLFTE